MLLEREAEFGQVNDGLLRAMSGAGSLLVVGGPLGNGKSALLSALPEIAAGLGVRALSASASVLERNFDLGLVRQLLGAVAPVDDPAGLERWVRVSTAERPLMLLVDDLQWADEASLKWLGRCARRLYGLRLLLVVTIREGDLGAEVPLVRDLVAAASSVLRPPPLSVPATWRLVREHFDADPDEEFVVACHESTGGNPAILRTVLRNLANRGVRPLADAVDRVRSARPRSLCGWMASSLRAQPESVRALAKAIAVLGDGADEELATRLAGLDPVGAVEALRSLRRMGLLAADWHPGSMLRVVREAVQRTMTVEEREKIHASAAELLRVRGFPAEQVAAQLLLVTAPQGPHAIEVLRSAADTALRRRAPETAARYLRRALLDSSVDGEDRGRLLVELATATRGIDTAASVRHISQAVPLLTSIRERAAAVVRLAPSVLAAATRPVRDLIRDLADELGSPDGLVGIDRDLAHRMEARVRHADIGEQTGLDAAVERLRGLGPTPGVATGAERELLTVLLHATTIAVRAGASDVAAAAGAILAREPASLAHVYTAMPQLVTTLAAADSLTGLSSWLDVAEEHAREQGATTERNFIGVERSFVLMHSGRIAEARSRALAALEPDAFDWNMAGPLSLCVLGAVALEARDEELGLRLLARYDEQNIVDNGLAAVMRMLRGAVVAAGGDTATALELFLDCGRQLDLAGWHNPTLFPWRLWAVVLHERAGDVDAAVDLAEEACARADAWGAPAARGRALRVFGRLVGGGRGVEALRRAVDVLEDSGNALELAKASLSLGGLLGATDRRGAEEHLARGHRLAAACGASGLVGPTPAGQAGAPGPHPTAAASGLTKTELRVARLAAEGRTNLEIATRYGVSLRSVEKHLTNAYRKLAIRGRGDLAEVIGIAG
ncbi:LuxR C-terminal-related transcriptional regulator [Umezawaea sp.]|uniref:LuxR C-terminal-related transcriptional regulator n=1 Tax=Umezawaea sp. TaxID=1955258 RepID=UPI002ED29DEA